MGIFSFFSKGDFDPMASVTREIESWRPDALAGWAEAQTTHDAVVWYEAIDALVLANLYEESLQALPLASARFSDLKPWCEACMANIKHNQGVYAEDESESMAYYRQALDHLVGALRLGRSASAERDMMLEILEEVVFGGELSSNAIEDLRATLREYYSDDAEIEAVFEG